MALTTSIRARFVITAISIIIVITVSESFEIRNYQESNLGCIYPCECPQLPSYVNARCDNPIVDQCGCCLICPRQLGERCNNDSQLCDSSSGLKCNFKSPVDLWGICTKLDGKQCFVDNQTYNHGEYFKIDCRTQCICINGTYGCVSLCPQELIEPKGSCQNPRLIEVPNQCCREWMCDSQLSQVFNCNQTETSEWSECSENCGFGTSHRTIEYFDQNQLQCKTKLEFRLCQIRPCIHFAKKSYNKIRKRHKCKPTLKHSKLTYYQQNIKNNHCESRKKYFLKYCNDCSDHNLICKPIRSKTITVDFICTETDNLKSNQSLWSDVRTVFEYSSTNKSLVQWTIMCKCFPT